jgi:hypothetical protein
MLAIEIRRFANALKCRATGTPRGLYAPVNLPISVNCFGRAGGQGEEKFAYPS